MRLPGQDALTLDQYCTQIVKIVKEWLALPRRDRDWGRWDVAVERTSCARRVQGFQGSFFWFSRNLDQKSMLQLRRKIGGM
jgi:hypothetical protein